MMGLEEKRPEILNILNNMYKKELKIKQIVGLGHFWFSAREKQIHMAQNDLCQMCSFASP